MKIGIFGGSFNPIHLGHQKIVEYVLQEMHLDKILVIPVGIPSHRENILEDALHRFQMCKLTFEHLKNVDVLDIEITKNEACYTYDTLLEIRDIYGEQHEYFEIIGEDSLAYFHSWKKAAEILKLAKLLVLQREPFALTSEDSSILLLNSPTFPVSSTEIRDKLRHGERDIAWISPKVLDYIRKHGLYQK